jgi:type II secretory pathway component PulF
VAATNFREALKATVLTVAVDTALWIVWFVCMLVYVPPMMRRFRDLDVHLPPFTQQVLAVAQWLNHYPYMIPSIMVLGIALDGGFGLLLRSNPQLRLLAWLWWGVMLALPLVAILGTWMALGFPPAS